ncbi:unnamed protein product [Symbiodinium pilosum]|uniref:Uncharacterized protein n=1 Tax=Symbiodinium pilosum TaxID=2952 RepID=A0A812TVH5_SYMPI|nr:unnamed protein product [Symbiodinium pilosum]
MAARNPLHADLVWRRSLEKELDAWCLQQLGITRHDSLETLRKTKEPPLPKMPAVGQEVVIQGSRCRPELNGLRAEVLDDSIDKAGRVTVRVFRPSDVNREGKGSRRMQIRATHLESRRSAPSLSAAGASAAYVGSQAPPSRS